MEIIFLKNWYKPNGLNEKILICEKNKSYFLLVENTFTIVRGSAETIACEAWSIFKENIPYDNYPLENRLVAFPVEKNLDTIFKENEDRFLPISKIRENNINFILSD